MKFIMLAVGFFVAMAEARAIEIHAFDITNQSPAVLATMSSLAGVVAKTSPEIYMARPDDNPDQNPKFWLAQYQAVNPSIKVTWHRDWIWFLRHYRQSISGYIVYNRNNEKINEATSLAGVTNAIIASEDLAPQLNGMGIPQILDARSVTRDWILQNYSSQLSHDIMCVLDPSINYHLRDYAIYKNAYVLSDVSAADAFLHHQKPNSLLLGWTSSELNFFRVASQYNLKALAADFLQDASVQSQWQVGPLLQRTHVSLPQPAPDDDVHYVAFVMSDGDNAQWLTNGFATDQRWYGSPRRGTFAMNWDLSPGVAHLSPIAVRYLYEKATTGKNADFFITAHGTGTDYPSEVTDLSGALQDTVRTMGEVDHNVISILDNQWRPDVLNRYLLQPQITGGMFKTNWCCGYAGMKGQKYWYQGKPIVSVKFTLWDGIQTADYIATQLNQLPRHPMTDENSYTVVNVHPWSTSGLGDPMSNLSDLVAKLDPHVRVVTLEELILRLKTRFGAHH